MQTGGKGLKRVMACEVLAQPARATRQRTREQEARDQGLQGSTTDSLQDPDADVQLDDQICLPNEGQDNALIVTRPRGESMGKGLDKLTRGLDSLMPLRIADGQKRLEAPVQAAKLASEYGIIVRNEIAVLTHWKEYKKPDDAAHFKEFLGKNSTQFSIDTNNTAVIAACTDLMKSGLRQFRYRLKKKYFNGVPANEVPTTSLVSSITDDQWRAPVEMWSSTKHKNKCEANKMNREKVVYHQATGSRSYVAHGYVVKQELRYKENPPTPIDLFKEFNCSSKTGFAEPVKEAVAKMETILAGPVEEGQAPKTAAEVFAEVLPSSRKFLQNAGFNPAPEKKNDKAAAAAAAACIQDLQNELEKKNQKSEALEEVGTLKEQVVEANKAIEKLRKDNEETQSFLRLMVSFNGKN